MAAYTSNSSGNWATPTVWTPNGVPGSGDTATVVSPHNVTVTASATVGTSPADQTTLALTVNNGATLTVNAPLTIKGNANFLGTLAGAAGGGIEFDSSGDGPGPHAQYAINTTYGSVLNLAGAPGNLFYVQSNASGGNAHFAAAGSLAALDLSYCQFLRLGSTTTAGETFQADSPDFGAGLHVLVDHCTFDTTGGLRLTAVRADVRVEITNCTWQNSYLNTLSGGGRPLNFVAGNNAPSTGTRIFTGNSLDLAPWFSVSTGWTVTGNYFGTGVYTLGSGTWAAFSGNFVRESAGTGTGSQYAGGFSGCYIFGDGAQLNWHPTSLPASGSHVVDRNVWEAPLGDQFGDLVIAGGQTLTITRNLVLPAASGKSIGKLVSPLSAGGSYTVEHNTVCSTDAATNTETGVGVYSETYAGAAGMYASLRANISYCPAGQNPGAIFTRCCQGAVSDAVTSSGGSVLAGHNCGNNLAGVGGDVQTSYGGGGYNDDVASPAAPMFTVTTGLGSGDVHADPAFVDPARGLAKWSVSQGYALPGDSLATKVAAALASLRASPALTQSSLLPYVRAGFRPSNVALQAASYSADAATADAAGNPYAGAHPDIGAMAFQGASASRGCLLGVG